MSLSRYFFKNLFLFLLTSLPFFNFSQERKNLVLVTGTIWEDVVSSGSQTSEPLLGVSVYLKNTPIGTTTNEKGKFSLSVPVGSYTIVFQSLGYQTIESPLEVREGRPVVINQTLKEEITQLKGITFEGKSPIKQVQESPYNVVAIAPEGMEKTNTNVADLLSKASGVKIREQGGVGAESQINLNGFTGRHVRTFVDGVPMSQTAASFQIGNIPVELIERIEIYKGVVPIAFGSDALGGAVNIVTKNRPKQYASLSYTFGSFNTHKSTLSAGLPLTDKIAVELNAYQNYSDNSYKVLTQYLNLQTGTYSRNKEWFKRFHDRYHNEAIIGKVHITGERWADRLSFGLNYNQEYKQLQNANLMQKVFGGKFRTSYTYSSSVEYLKRNLLPNLTFSLSGRYDLSRTNNVDEEARRYSWNGDYEVMPTRGESQWQNTVFEGKTAFLTSLLGYKLRDKHFFELSHTFSNYNRQNKNMLLTNYTLDSDYFRRINKKNIAGLSYKFSPFKRWNLLTFGKYYASSVTGPVTISGNGSLAVFQERTHSSEVWGYGIASTYDLLKNFQGKLSYEKTFRLPSDIELFGDGDLEVANYGLKPENSDNLNLNLSFQPSFKNHSLLIEAGFAYRYIKDYIIRSIISAGSNEGSAGSRNHGKVRNLSLDASLRYFYKDAFSIGGNLSYMDMRNQEEYTETGRPSAIYNDRLPNMPYLFGNADASYNFKHLFSENDALSLNYNLAYTKEFFISWQSEGAKIIVPTQLSHDVSVTYNGKNNKYSFSFEVRNLTDELLYDNYSLQKAGRAFYGKVSYRF